MGRLNATRIEMGITTRTSNVLIACGLLTLGDILDKSAAYLRACPGMGVTGIEEIERLLLRFKMTLPTATVVFGPRASLSEAIEGHLLARSGHARCVRCRTVQEVSKAMRDPDTLVLYEVSNPFGATYISDAIRGMEQAS